MSQCHEFITGSEAVVRGALEAGADVMFGYPITPSTEILQGWITEAEKDSKLKYLQTEDETSAGFAVCGALLAGAKAFTATAGPGTVLMQDPLSMAENLRLPFVTFVMQRGGPSTGTVNFSQQEVNLAAFGGNGDGLRIVYSASTVLELYSLAAKAFSVAWKYRFPTFVLGDGHLAKMQTKVRLIPQLKPIRSKPILREAELPTFLRNCYSNEETFGQKLQKNIEDWNELISVIAEYETYKIKQVDELIVAHGSVADVAKDAIDILQSHGKKIGLFRPITVHPFPGKHFRDMVSDVKKVYIVESSLNQLARIVKYEANGLKTEMVEISKPAIGFTAEEIAGKILKGKK
jgi:2-oxoglutarate ferredoxin oxidoreductase subunit alpha